MNDLNVLDILERLESTSSSNAKLQILQEGLQNPIIQEIMDAVYNYKRKFWLDDLSFLQVPAKKGIVVDTGVSWKVFQSILNKLESRQATGDAAKTLVLNYFINYVDEPHSKWFQRVIRKDLRIGVGLTTVIKAGFAVPDFDVMLAKDARKCTKLDKLVSDGVWISKKLDGYRCLCIVENYEPTLFTRSGTVYDNFPAIKEAIKEFCTGLGIPAIVLDGEIMSDSFQDMQRSAFASKRGTTVGDMKYFIFDCVKYEEWMTQAFKEKAGDRYSNLKTLFEKNPNKDLPLVEVLHEFTKSMAYVESKEVEYIGEGYEGLMTIGNIPYYLGKKTNKMLKFKQFETMEATIDGVYQGEGKYEGTLGGLNLTQENGVKVNCAWRGDAERDEIWANPDSIIGRTIELKFQNLSEDKVARFPVFVRFRDSGQRGKI